MRSTLSRRARRRSAISGNVLPYENFLVTAEFGPVELKVMMEEVLQSRESRSLAGFAIFGRTGDGRNRRLTNLRLANGRPLDPARRYRIALNTFDSPAAAVIVS